MLRIIILTRDLKRFMNDEFIIIYSPVLRVHRWSCSVTASHPFSVQSTQSQSIVPYVFGNLARDLSYLVLFQ